METLLITNALGIYMLVAGTAILINKKGFNNLMKGLLKNDACMFGIAFFVVILGAFLVAAHNVWEPGWTLVITIVAWLTLLKGILLLVFPKQANTFYKFYMKKVSLTAGGVFAVVLGMLFLYVGFIY